MLFIENQLIDVSKEFSTAITYAIDDIKDFGSKDSAYSKTIILPGTARNNKLLGNIFSVTQSNPYDATGRNILTNFNASKRANAIIFVDNLQVFKGTFRLMKIIDDNGNYEYEAQVVGELGGLVAALGALKLEDLDFSEYDHVFNESNVVASWDSIKGKGYYYPLIDYANMSTNKLDWDIKTFRPALYAREYIVKSFANAGYRFSSAIIDSKRFRELVITSTRKDSGQTYITESFRGPLQPKPYYPSTGGSVVTLGLPSTNLFYKSGSQIAWQQGAGFTTDHNITVEYLFDTPPDSGCNIQIDLRKNGSIIKSIVDTVPGVPGYTGSISLLHASEPTTTGDYFDIKIKVIQTGDPITEAFSITGGSWVVTNDPSFLYSSVYGAAVNVNSGIPKNILQKDFISSIAKLFNLLIYEDNTQSKLLRMEPYIDFYELGGGNRFLEWSGTDLLNINDAGDHLLIDDGSVNAVDWSYKLNRSKPIEIIPMSELNARYYDFKYKQDSDYWNDDYQKKYNETYGSRRYDSEFEFSKDVQDVSLIFASTPLIQYSPYDKIMPAIYKLSGQFGVVDTKETPYEGSIRILQAKKITCSAWSIKNDTTVLTTVTSYGYAGHFDDPATPGADLNFGATRELYYAGLSTTNNQFNLYWSAYMAEITDKDSRLITAWFRLTDLDIAQLDFSKFIWIDGNLYRLNKIEEWNASYPDECRVTLLKVIQTQY